MVFDILGRRKADREKYGERLPPGQKVVEDWPVLTYGGTPRVDLKDWRFRAFGEVEQEVEWKWKEITALPKAKVRCDIHCVTSWSRFDNDFEGVAIPDLMKQIRPKSSADAVMVHSYGGYTTNLLLNDLVRENNLLAYEHDGTPLEAQHGGPCRLVVPHLYFWKS
ncbi:MAG TPA: molybdopterin-dependent oxidoreductase, partial [Dehalococcoidia bacterium]|nr:molybdopterin-dependent oxidoreductase [Dehalococcoidia bacterium]